MDGNVRDRNGLGGRVARISVVLAVAAAWSWTLVGSAAATTSPDVTITKTSDASGPVSVGDGFSYTITVENVGSATAQDIEVQDNLPLGVHVTTLVPTFPGGQCTVVASVGTGHPEHWSVTCTRGSLAAGASVAATFGVKLTSDIHCGSLTNTASVSALNEPVASQGNNEGSVTETVTCPPSVQITKTAPTFAHVGSRIPFTMHVTNTGAIALDHLTVTDPGCDSAPHGNGGMLSPGMSRTYHCTHVVRAGAADRFSTTATVNAASASGSAQASARATTKVLKPTLSISVTPNSVSGVVGETVDYRYVVRNTGNTTLTHVTVTDDHLGAVGSLAQLAPGHTATFSMPRTLSASQVWVTNTATVTGRDSSGHRVTASDHASVTIVARAAHNGGSSGSGDGTAFTGGDATLPGLAAMALAVVGVASLLLAARRRS